jgi:CheY-like chemotaxis protein
VRIYRILVVDDDEDARVLLMRALAKSALALEVATAADGRQALEAVARRRPDAIITDIMMPRMDGFDLCIALRADPATEDIPVIMVTALEGERDRQRGLAVGADTYLTKPFSWNALTARLAELLAAAHDRVG